jgi:predicted Zn-dependent protease
MFIKIVKLIFIIILSGCIRKPELPIHKFVSIDDSFSGIQRNDIIISLDEWKVSTNNYFDYTLTNQKYDEDFYYNCKEDSLFILNKKSTSDDILMRENHYPTLLGLALFRQEPCPYEKIFIVTDRIYTRQLFKFVSLHEIGHILNLKHNNKKSIMNIEYSDGLFHLTEYDIDLFFEANKPH